MSAMDAWDREYDRLIDDLEAGLITQEEYDEDVRHLERDRRWAAEEEAEAAYNDVMGYW